MARIQGPAEFSGNLNLPTAGLPRNMDAQARELRRLNLTLQQTGDTIISVSQGLKEDREEINDVAFRSEIAAKGRPALEAEYLAATSELDPASDDYLTQIGERLAKVEEATIESAIGTAGQAKVESVNAARVSLANQRANLQIRAMSAQHNASVKQSEIAVNGALDEFPRQAIRNPADVPLLLQEAEEIVKSGAKFIDDPAAKLSEIRTSIVLSGLNGLIKQDTDAALAVLSSGEFSEDIPEERFGELVALAFDELDKQEVDLNERGRELRDSVEREVLSNIYDPNQPTPSLDSLTGMLDRGLLSREGFNSAKSALQSTIGGAAVSEPSTRLGLLERAIDGDPGVRKDINEAVSDQRLSQDDAASILRTFNSSRDADGILQNREVKRQLDLFQNVLVARDAFGNVLGDEDDRVRFFNLTNEFIDLVSSAVAEGEDPAKTARKVASNLIEENRKQPQQPAELPQPGLRVGPASAPDIKATKKAIFDAWQANEITDAEAERQTLQIEAIESALEERNETLRQGFEIKE